MTAPATSSSPLVSILINNYNYADYLPVAIRSVLKQTYPQTEVVVVDDGSTDASRQVIEMFSGQVSIVLQENSGQPAAGQAGLKASSGDIVMFLDADDFLYPDAVSRVVDAWQPGCSKVQFRLSLVDADGIRFGADPPWGLPMPSGDLLGQLAATGRYQTPVTSGNAFPRTLLERLFPFSAEFDALDHYLNTVVPLFGPVISIEDELGAYRQHGRNRWAFSGGVNIDRLRERVRYDLIKERQLHQTAAEQGLYLPSNLVQCNPEHLLHRLGSLRLDPVGHPQRADSRRALLVAGLSALRRETSLSGVDWVFQATVLLLVAVLPTRLATPLLFWVVGGGRRPTCVRQVAGLLRRSGSRARPSHKCQSAEVANPEPRLGQRTGVAAAAGAATRSWSHSVAFARGQARESDVSVTGSRARVLRHLRRHGPVKAFHRLVSHVRPFIYLHETHVWSTLDLAEPRPRLPLPEGFEMFQAGSAEVALVGPLEVDVEQSYRRLAEGAELWLVRHGTQIAHAGWIFHGHAPTIAAPGGAVRLPLRTVNPEDMVTAPQYRGRGLASAGYSLLFDDLERTGRATRIVGKVPEDNTANRRALVKSGWQEFAIVDFRRLGPYRRSRVRPIADVGEVPSAVAKEMMRWLKSAIIVGRPRHSGSSGKDAQC